MPVAFEAIFSGTAWVSEKKKAGRLPRRREKLGDPYFFNEAWQDYLRTNRPQDMKFTVIFDDSDRFMIHRKNVRDGVDVFVTVPADWFRNGADPVATYASVVERTYKWAVEQFGWPPAPPPITS